MASRRGGSIPRGPLPGVSAAELTLISGPSGTIWPAAVQVHAPSQAPPHLPPPQEAELS